MHKEHKTAHHRICDASLICECFVKMFFDATISPKARHSGFNLNDLLHFINNVSNSFSQCSPLIVSHTWSHPCSPARSPRPRLSDWQGKTGVDEDGTVHLTAIKKTNFMCRSPMLPLAPIAPPLTLNSRALTSHWGGRPCYLKTGWTGIHTATETPSARGQTSTQMLLPLALDQCYHIRQQPKSLLRHHHPLSVVSLMIFVFVSKLRYQQIVPMLVQS